MDFVDGTILREQLDAEDMSEHECRTATESLIDVQLAFHGLDLERIGLTDLGRHGGYVARQLKRWLTQYVRGDLRRLPLLEELHAKLASAIPPERTRPGLAHGDYRFDNTILGADFRVAAVLDWELCTLGDPIADFAWSMMYWADPGDEFHFLSSPPTLHPSFMRRDAMVELYAERSGLDVSDLPYFVAFSWWKMACIVEGVHGRMRAGVRGGLQSNEDHSQIAARVERMLELAQEAARGVL
jgi:aminoglycoside phosphotransferase (APT) family kinase protein